MSGPTQVQASPQQIQSWLIASDPSAPAYWGMLMLGMAAQAYTDEGNTSTTTSVVAALQTAIQNTQYTPPPPAGPNAVMQGYWNLDWAANTSDNANLIYIASFRTSGNNPNYPQDGSPYFYVVGIRGTDTSTGYVALVQQIFQDCQNFITADWSHVLDGTWLDPASKLVEKVPLLKGSNAPTQFAGQNIVGGSARGFRLLANLPPTATSGQQPTVAGQPVLLALQALFAVDQAPKGNPTPIIVTGHSLGAGQTQLMASYMQWQFSQVMTNCLVVPYCYAPPTAGDSNFINYFTANQCPNIQFYYNTHDVVPYAYIEMQLPQNQSELGLVWAGANLWTAYNWPPAGMPLGASLQGPPLPSPLPALISDLQGNVQVMSRPDVGLFPLTNAGQALPSYAQVEGLMKGMGLSTAPSMVMSGGAQLIWQHFPPCYQGLMNQTYTTLGVYDWTAYSPPA